jgi:hypothetical protein
LIKKTLRDEWGFVLTCASPNDLGHLEQFDKQGVNHSTNMKKLSIICLMGILSVGGINALRADDSKPAKEEKSTGTTQRSIPFHGKIESLDIAAKSIKVGTRVFVVSETTKITKAGKASSFEEAKVGEEVGGAYRDTAGKLELTSLRVGPKPAKEK